MSCVAEYFDENRSYAIGRCHDMPSGQYSDKEADQMPDYTDYEKRSSTTCEYRREDCEYRECGDSCYIQLCNKGTECETCSQWTKEAADSSKWAHDQCDEESDVDLFDVVRNATSHYNDSLALIAKKATQKHIQDNSEGVDKFLNSDKAKDVASVAIKDTEKAASHWGVDLDWVNDLLSAGDHKELNTMVEDLWKGPYEKGSLNKGTDRKSVV